MLIAIALLFTCQALPYGRSESSDSDFESQMAELKAERKRGNDKFKADLDGNRKLSKADDTLGVLGELAGKALSSWAERRRERKAEEEERRNAEEDEPRERESRTNPELERAYQDHLKRKSRRLGLNRDSSSRRLKDPELDALDDTEPPKHDDTETPEHDDTETPEHDDTEPPPLETKRRKRVRRPASTDTEPPKHEDNETPEDSATEPPPLETKRRKRVRRPASTTDERRYQESGIHGTLEEAYQQHLARKAGRRHRIRMKPEKHVYRNQNQETEAPKKNVYRNAEGETEPPKKNVYRETPNEDDEETPKENAPEKNVYASVKFRPANEQYSHEEAKKLLTSKIGAILWRDSVRVNMRSVVIQELFELRKDLTRLYPNDKKPLPEIHINSGTDGRHAGGTYSHGTGYKVDLDDQCKKFMNYIYKHMKKIEKRSSDGADQYVPKRKRKFASKVVYALEYIGTANGHVDILVVP